jgi:hypothetical protein
MTAFRALSLLLGLLAGATGWFLLGFIRPDWVAYSTKSWEAGASVGAVSSAVAGLGLLVVFSIALDLQYERMRPFILGMLILGGILGATFGALGGWLASMAPEDVKGAVYGPFWAAPVWCCLMVAWFFALRLPRLGGGPVEPAPPSDRQREAR